MTTVEAYAKQKDLTDLKDRVGKIEGDLNMVKKAVADLETDVKCLPSIDKRLSLTQQNMASLAKNTATMIWLIVGMFVTTIGSLVVFFITKV